MVSPRWRKILRDMWSNRVSSLLVIFSIAIGVFAIGTIAGAYAILSDGMTESFLAINPANAQIYTVESFDEAMLDAIRNLDEIQDVVGRYTLIVRFKVGENEWRNLHLFTLPDYADIRVNLVKPKSGAWPPPKKELVIEQNALSLLNGGIGSTLLIETPDGKERELRVAGVAHEMNLFPAALAGIAYGYITFETLEWLGIPYSFNEALIIAKNRFDREGVQQAINRVQDRLETYGIATRFIYMPMVPGRHDAQDIVEALTIVLGVLGVLVLLLSGFLVINTMSALLIQQVRHIGVMKTFGARFHQLLPMYLSMAVVFGLLAVALAMPLAGIGADALSKFVLGIINLDVPNFEVPVQVYALQLFIGVAVPVGAALYPVLSGTRITIREALQSQAGNATGRGGRWLDQLLAGLPTAIQGRAPRPLLLSLRNTFRKTGRMALTLATLTLGSAIFIAVFSVRASTLLTFTEAAQNWQYDVEVTLQRPYLLQKLEQIALQVPGVVKAEGWGVYNTRRVRPDGSESTTIILLAPPAETVLVRPVLVEGRWLQLDDVNSIVVDRDLIRREPDIKLGDTLTLKVEERELAVQIVGIAKGQFKDFPTAYVSYPYFAQQMVREIDRAGRMVIVAERHDPAFQAQVAGAVEKEFKRVGLKIGLTETVYEIRSRVEDQFNIVVIFLLLMALLMSAVGGFGLTGTMSLNVLERVREIGVMRAIGASNRAVQSIVMVEGVIIGLLSWFLGAVLARPLSKFLSDAVGMAMTNSPLTYSFASSGIFIWLFLVLLLATIATFLPAWKATRISVRETLAHE